MHEPEKNERCANAELVSFKRKPRKRAVVDEGCWGERPEEGLTTASGVVTGAGAGIAIDMLVAEEIYRAPRGSVWQEM